MNYLPDGDEELKVDRLYWKMSQMKEGDNKFRIVMRPIAGWIDWKDNKPLRFLPADKPAKSQDPEKPMKPFWACYVWDYTREGLYILEITQNSILKTLRSLTKDDDWGDFTQYDLKLKKEGANKETKYTLTPLPHKPLSDKIKEALKKYPVRLEELYEGGDPWNPDLNRETGEILLEVGKVQNPLEVLKEKLEMEKIATDKLEGFLENRAQQGEKPIATVISSALNERVYPRFKQMYQNFISGDVSVLPAT
jgi:hypothetical protein